MLKLVGVKKRLGNQAVLQGVDLTNLGPFHAESIEQELDYLTILIQQLREKVE